MAYQTGKANNERDFLAKLNQFLTNDAALKAAGQAWQKLYERTLPATLTIAIRYPLLLTRATITAGC